MKTVDTEFQLLNRISFMSANIFYGMPQKTFFTAGVHFFFFNFN